MLQGLDVEPNAHENSKHLKHEPELVYEDEWMAAVNKPAGMLSVPGKGDAPSVWITGGLFSVFRSKSWEAK